MARKLIRRFLPTPHAVKNTPGLRSLGTLLHDPHLFHLNRHSVSLAVFLGVFLAFMQVPGQMLLAALVALWVRCNLPIAVSLVWITNPLTITPIFYACYRLGRRLLDLPRVRLPQELSWGWLLAEFNHIWQPLLLGSLVMGFACGGLGYILMQLFWRWQVVRHWQARAERRRQQRQSHS